MNPENQQEKLFQEFESADLETWKAAAIKMLKGKSLEALNHLSYEGIDIAPIYTTDQGIEALPLPHSPKNWLNQMSLTVENHNETKLNAIARKAIQNGVDSIRFICVDDHDIEFEQLFDQIDPNNVSLTLNFLPQSVNSYQALNASNFEGNIFFDFLNDWVFGGNLEEAYSDKLLEITQNSLESNVKTIEIATSAFHLRAASLTQELALALSMAVQYIDELSQKGLSVAQIIPKIAFTLGISGDYFMEIAKFRAMRLLWAQIVKAYQVEHVPCFIQARTGLWNKYPEDEYNNILRTTTEALSAVVGNCDVLMVGSFKEYPTQESKSNELSLRIARNISNILKYESHLDKIIDPAYGSYYMEYLTKNITEKAWSIFQEIEKKGGFIKAFEKGFIEELVRQVTEQRQQDFDSGKAVFVGVNKYQNPKDEANQ